MTGSEAPARLRLAEPASREARIQVGRAASDVTPRGSPLGYGPPRMGRRVGNGVEYAGRVRSLL